VHALGGRLVPGDLAAGDLVLVVRRGAAVVVPVVVLVPIVVALVPLLVGDVGVAVDLGDLAAVLRQRGQGVDDVAVGQAGDPGRERERDLDRFLAAEHVDRAVTQEAPARQHLDGLDLGPGQPPPLLARAQAHPEVVGDEERRPGVEDALGVHEGDEGEHQRQDPVQGGAAGGGTGEVRRGDHARDDTGARGEQRVASYFHVHISP
jgi:hypothetical protein